MILSGQKIKQLVGTDIKIEPFDENMVNPNSYNLRLADELLVYDNYELDMKKRNTASRIVT